MAKIYLIYNLQNQKKYVGSTSGNASQRFCQHIDCSYRKNQNRRNSFYEELKESGENVFNVFKLSILCECEEKHKKEKEKYYIKKIKPEYNEVFKNSFLEDKKDVIIKEYNNGLTIDQLRKKYKCRQPYISKILKKENIFIDKGRNSYSKKIYLFNEKGLCIKEWLNAGLCSKDLNIDRGNIRCCALKNTKENMLYYTANGYYFKYNKETPKDMYIITNKDNEEKRFKTKEDFVMFFENEFPNKKILYGQLVRNRKTIYGYKIKKIYEHRN